MPRPGNVHPPARPRSSHEAVAEVLDELGLRAVGFESSASPSPSSRRSATAAADLDWKGAADRVERLRMVKDAVELAEIREAIAIAERAFTVFRACCGRRTREKDLCDALEGLRPPRRRPADRLSAASSPSASGPPCRTAPPTAQARSTAAGLLLVDWGASGRPYKSDLTRVLDTRTNSSFRADGG